MAGLVITNIMNSTDVRTTQCRGNRSLCKRSVVVQEALGKNSHTWALPRTGELLLKIEQRAF